MFLSKFIRGSSAFLFALRLGGAGIGFLTQIFLARILGSHDLGLFYSATSLAAVGGFVMSQGYSQIAYRFSARYRGQTKTALFKAFVSRSAYDGLLASTLAAFVIVACATFAPQMAASERIIWRSPGR